MKHTKFKQWDLASGSVLNPHGSDETLCSLYKNNSPKTVLNPHGSDETFGKSLIYEGLKEVLNPHGSDETDSLEPTPLSLTGS